MRSSTVGMIFCAAIFTFFAGWFVGFEHANDQLPACEKDEVLFPADYKGPGDNNTADYGCVHVDAIAKSANPNVLCDAFETDEIICVDGRTGEVVN